MIQIQSEAVMEIKQHSKVVSRDQFTLNAFTCNMLEGNVVGLFYSLKERKKRILEDEATALQVAYRQCGAFNTPCDCDQTTK